MNDESRWIDQAKEGDHKAFKLLYEQYVTPLYRFMRQFSSDPDEAEEWTQRAFIKAFEHLGGFDGRARFSSWLFKLALNEMRMDRRRATIVPFIASNTDEYSPEPEPDLIEWRETMRTWLEDLDETKRTVFVLYEVEGYSHAEIASLLEIGESTSRTILSRTKQYLKTRWQNEEVGR
jgi:RNA polymerase sigma-70 factor (ECF subfamily)